MKNTSILGVGVLLFSLAICVAEDLVQTPKGLLPRSNVHAVSQEDAVRERDGKFEIVEKKSGRIKYSVDTQGGFPPIRRHRWVTYTDWRNNTGKPIRTFRSTWKVPSEPTQRSSQLIYLFNGLEPASQNLILQPVLQWGSSPAGGGRYWSVASWYVSSAGQAAHTSAVRVEPGDTLVGVMTMRKSSGTRFEYFSIFDGVSKTDLTIQEAPEMIVATETLEDYGVSQCAHYPGDVEFTNIGLDTTEGLAPLEWTVHDAVRTCGQHVKIVSNSALNGEVRIIMGSEK